VYPVPFSDKAFFFGEGESPWDEGVAPVIGRFKEVGVGWVSMLVWVERVREGMGKSGKGWCEEEDAGAGDEEGGGGEQEKGEGGEEGAGKGEEMDVEMSD
jgi:hypothetical protein